jgi:hypothetical protein
MDQARKAIARVIPLTALFALATYLALNIQTCIGDSPIFNKTLGLGLPLIIGGYDIYVNLTAVITDVTLATIAYSILAKGKPRASLTKYSPGIITVYALIVTVIYLTVTAAGLCP